MPSAGSPPQATAVTNHRQVWSLAGPVILSNVSIPLLSAVDTAVMGHLPDPAYLGGVGLGGLIFSYIYWGFGFLRMGTTGLVAQARGAGNTNEVRAIVARATLLAIVLAAGILVLQWPIAWAAFAVLQADDQVETLAQAYYRIRIWGAPAALLNYALLGWLFGMLRMGAAVTLTIFMNGLNIALDLLFVVGFGWGIEDVAAATLIAEWSALGLGAWIITGHLRALGGGWRLDHLLDRPRMVALIRINSDIFVRTLCLITGFAIFTAEGAKIGTVVLAANVVLLNFQSFMTYALDGFAHAAETLVGGAIGARDRGALRAAVRTTTIWAAVFAALFTAAYILLGPSIIAALTDLPAVRAAAADYLPWVIAMPMVSVWSYQLDGIFIGATRGAEMRNAMIVSLATFVAAVWLLVPLAGNHGLWLALTLLMAMRGITLLAFYPRIARAAAAGGSV